MKFKVSTTSNNRTPPDTHFEETETTRTHVGPESTRAIFKITT